MRSKSFTTLGGKSSSLNSYYFNIRISINTAYRNQTSSVFTRTPWFKQKQFITETVITNERTAVPSFPYTVTVATITTALNTIIKISIVITVRNTPARWTGTITLYQPVLTGTILPLVT
ncbi:hypothetical protein T09_8578 [Trichinella sp. T9]|nr:hypothetical protein T09_8578 [Trichinella sp. T9]